MTKPTIPIEISARHIHVTAADWTMLFGDAQMTSRRTISQPGQFAAQERVSLRGPNGQLDQVAIVGPFRQYTQAELAMTDARRLGIRPPLSESGQLNQAVEVTIIGPVGSITRSAAILQRRHIHASTIEANHLELTDGQEVSVEVPGSRGGRLDHVVVRVSPQYSLSLHLDTDEANAFGIIPSAHATLV